MSMDMKKSIPIIAKIILIVLIVIVTFINLIRLFTDSTVFDLNTVSFEVRSENENFNTVLEKTGDKLVLNENHDISDSDWSVSGEYYKSADTVKLNQVYENLDDKEIGNIWILSNNSDEWLAFSNNKKQGILFLSDDEHYIFDYDYNANQLTISFNSKRPNLYSINISDNEKSSFNSVLESNTSEVDHEFDFTVLNQLFTWFVSDVIVPWFWEIIAAAVCMLILYILVFKRTSRLIRKNYTRNLRGDLFPKEHAWFGNNMPHEIYVSGRAYLKNGYIDYNLLDYVNDVAFKDNSTVHAIIGNAGEGKTFSLSRISLGILDDYFSIEAKKSQNNKKNTITT